MDTPHNDFVDLTLLDFETTQVKILGSITTVTFYDGAPPLEYIKTKLEEILDRNPWIEGRLLSNATGQLVLRYPKVSGGAGQLLRIVSRPGLRPDMKFSELADVLRASIVKPASLCLNKAEDLLRVSVVTVSANRFAIVVSMSHAYADGYTYYEVFKMLSTTAPARALIAERVHSGRADMSAALSGGDDALPWLSSPGFIMNVATMLLRQRVPTFNLFTVAQLTIDEQKKTYATSNQPAFISTNDIITAAFFVATPCDVVFMMANFRSRVPDLTADHAGNYELLIAFQKVDFATPVLVRRGVSACRRTLSGNLPGFLKSTRVQLGAITNWASSYKDLALPGCELVFHRPVVDPARFMPFDHMVTVFKSRGEQLSLMTRCKDTSVLLNLPILDKKIV